MSRESNDAFDAYAAREGYKPGTWNYIRAAKAWQAALDYAAHGLNTTPVVDQKAANLSDNAPGVAIPAACRFQKTYCSQCGTGLGPGNEGVSSCCDHGACQIKARGEDDCPTCTPEKQ